MGTYRPTETYRDPHTYRDRHSDTQTGTPTDTPTHQHTEFLRVLSDSYLRWDRDDRQDDESHQHDLRVEGEDTGAVAHQGHGDDNEVDSIIEV